MKTVCRMIGVAVLLTMVTTSQSAADERPNIVLIFVDDLGWADVGCYGNEFIDTPHIDSLAHQGMRFTDFYAAGAVCSPTRCAVQTGQNQARIGITAHIPGHWRPFERVITPMTTMALPLQAVTIGEALRDAGYATGYIGKWHLGNSQREGPGKQGYDFAAEISGPHLPGRFRLIGNQNMRPKPGQYRTEFEADLGVQFIKDNVRNPFFLMISPYAVHIPLAAMSDKVAKYQQRAGGKLEGHLPHPVYAAMVEHVDDLVGRIVAAVQEQDLAQKTMIVFTSDNGGLHRRYDFQAGVDDTVATQDPLRDEKGSLYEGGIRVPLIVKYPPVVAKGATCAAPTISYDFFPTFAELAKAELPANQVMDGLSLLPLLKDAGGQLDRQAIHFHYPHYHHSRPASAIRKGEWKLIEFLDDRQLELYDLAADIGESRDIAEKRPGIAKALQRELQQWRLSVGARMPLKNPHYDPQRAGQWWSRRTGEPVNSSGRRKFPPTEKADARK